LDSEWRSPAVSRLKARDPHRLRVNSYRVLLARGRDRFFIFYDEGGWDGDDVLSAGGGGGEGNSEC